MNLSSLHTVNNTLLIRVVPDFSSGSGKSGIWQFLEIWPSLALTKFLSGFGGFGRCQTASAAAVYSVNYG